MGLIIKEKNAESGKFRKLFLIFIIFCFFISGIYDIIRRESLFLDYGGNGFSQLYKLYNEYAIINGFNKINIAFLIFLLGIWNFVVDKILQITRLLLIIGSLIYLLIGWDIITSKCH